MSEGTVIPQHLNFPKNPLPIASKSRSYRKFYYPSNSSKFSTNAANIIKLKLNSTDLIDFNHSYLQATFTNKSTASVGMDIGAPWIKKIEIRCRGQLLEVCGGDEYNRLYASLCQMQCNPSDCGSEWSMTQASPYDVSQGSTIVDGTQDKYD